jgi:hypothetical protein
MGDCEEHFSESDLKNSGCSSFSGWFRWNFSFDFRDCFRFRIRVISICKNIYGNLPTAEKKLCDLLLKNIALLFLYKL